MKNIKVSLVPPYRPENENYISEVECSIEFDNEASALNFVRELNMLIIRFNDKANKDTNNG